MQRIKWIHKRLGDWAMWRMSGSGGYTSPSYDLDRVDQSADYHLGIEALIDAEFESNAVDMDQAIASLPDELKRTVVAVYTWAGGMDVVVSKLRVTRATVHRRLCNADIRIVEWFNTRAARVASVRTGLKHYATYTK